MGKWERFIVAHENKASLTNFLSTQISRNYRAHPRHEQVVSGGFSDILKVWSSDHDDSGHEEADTKIVLHARDATVTGYKQVNVLCRDTYVLNCPLVWMFSETSKRKRYRYQFTRSHCPKRR